MRRPGQRPPSATCLGKDTRAGQTLGWAGLWPLPLMSIHTTIMKVLMTTGCSNMTMTRVTTKKTVRMMMTIRMRMTGIKSISSVQYLVLRAVTSVEQFLSDPGIPGVRSMGPSVSKWVTEGGCADLTDMTLADEDTNSIPTDNGNKAIQGNVAMEGTWPGGQLWNLMTTWLVSKFATSASGAT